MRDYRRVKLNNGMTVILKEDTSAPVVAIQVWVKVGSADETDDKAGICHLIEHMLFKGTEKRGAGEIAYEIESSGGEINAYTSFDQTVYHVSIAGRFFELGLDILSDTVGHPCFDPEEMEKEKEVILEEIKRGEDNPGSKLSQALFSTCYETHSYKRPIIGFRDTVKGLTRDDLLDFHRVWYGAGNIVLVVVGDLDSDAALIKIEKAFKDFIPGNGGNHNRVEELPQKRTRSCVIAEDIIEGYLNVAFHVPCINHKDSYALDVLSFILGNGESSRLFRKVKDDKGLVHGIQSYYFMPKEPGLMVVSAMMDKENSTEALDAILEETYRLRFEKVNEDELEKAKLNIESDFVYGNETVEGQARQLGSFEVIAKNVAFEKDYLDRIYRVRRRDIMRVAKRYLISENLTATFLLPKEGLDPVDHETIQDIASKTETGLKVHYSKLHAKKRSGVEKTVLENGMTLLIKEEHSTPLVAMRAAFLGGLRFEEKKLNGVNNFIAEMISKGTKDLNALQIAKEIESMAGSILGFSGRNSFGLQAEVLSRFFNRGLSIFADMIINPTFDSLELEKKRVDILAALKQQEDNLVYHAFNTFAETIYEKHPYGMNMLGHKDSILNMTRDDLKEYYGLYAGPGNLVLSIIGDVNTDDTVKKVREYFKEFADIGFIKPEIVKEPIQKSIRNVEVYKDKKQAHLVMGFLSTTVYSPDRYPLEVLNNVLSGQAGRLFVELRDRLSLAYSVTSFFHEGLDPGFIGIYIGTSPDKLDPAIDAVKKELKRVREEKITPEELERAKRYMIGGYEIGLQTNSAKAATTALAELYGLGHSHFLKYPENISHVTADDVFMAARKYIDLDRYSIAVIRPGD